MCIAFLFSILFSFPSPDSSDHRLDYYLLSCSGLRSFSAMPGPNPFRRSMSAEGGDGLPPPTYRPNEDDAITPTTATTPRITSIPGLQDFNLHPILLLCLRGSKY